MTNPHLEALYNQIAAAEKETKESLIDFEQKYPGVTNEANVNDIIKSLQERKRIPLKDQLSQAQPENEKNIQAKKTKRKRNAPEL